MPRRSSAPGHLSQAQQVQYGQRLGEGAARCFSLSGGFQSQEQGYKLSAIPEAFVCPLSLGVMLDPVVALDGSMYERSQIEMWFRRCAQSNTPLSSPNTGLDLPSPMVLPAYVLQHAIETYLNHSPELKNERLAARAFQETAEALQQDLSKHTVRYDELARLKHSVDQAKTSCQQLLSDLEVSSQSIVSLENCVVCDGHPTSPQLKPAQELCGHATLHNSKAFLSDSMYSCLVRACIWVASHVSNTSSMLTEQVATASLLPARAKKALRVVGTRFLIAYAYLPFLWQLCVVIGIALSIASGTAMVITFVGSGSSSIHLSSSSTQSMHGGLGCLDDACTVSAGGGTSSVNTGSSNPQVGHDGHGGLESAMAHPVRELRELLTCFREDGFSNWVEFLGDENFGTFLDMCERPDVTRMIAVLDKLMNHSHFWTNWWTLSYDEQVGATTKLVKHLHEDARYLPSLAAETLAWIATSNSSSVVHAGAIRPLVHLLHNASNVTEHAVRALKTLAEVNPGNAAQIRDAGAMYPLVRLLRTWWPTPNIQIEAMYALYFIVLDVKNKVVAEAIHEAFDAGAIEASISILEGDGLYSWREHDIDLAIAACELLTAFAAASVDYRIEMSRANVIVNLVSLLRNPSNLAKEKSATLLLLISRSTTYIQSSIVKAGAIKPLFNMLRNGNPYTASLSYYTLLELKAHWGKYKRRIQQAIEDFVDAESWQDGDCGAEG